jgi:hypothetical protein
MIEHKVVEIDQRIERLTDISAKLRHAASCPTSHVLGCPFLPGCVRAAALADHPPEPDPDAHCDATAPAPT